LIPARALVSHWWQQESSPAAESTTYVFVVKGVDDTKRPHNVTCST